VTARWRVDKRERRTRGTLAPRRVVALVRNEQKQRNKRRWLTERPRGMERKVSRAGRAEPKGGEAVRYVMCEITISRP